MWVVGEQGWRLCHLGETDAQGVLRYRSESGRSYRLAVTIALSGGVHHVPIPDADETLDLREDRGRWRAKGGRQLVRMAGDWYQVLEPHRGRQITKGRYVSEPRLSGASATAWTVEEERNTDWHQTPLDQRRWSFSFNDAPSALARATFLTSDDQVVKSQFFRLTWDDVGADWTGNLYPRGEERWSRIEVEPVTLELIEELTPKEMEDFIEQINSLITSWGDEPAGEGSIPRLRELWQPLLVKAGEACSKGGRGGDDGRVMQGL